MTDSDWHKHYTRCLGMRLEGNMDDEIDERGRHITGDTLLILFNSHNEPIPFLMPPHIQGEYWQPLLGFLEHAVNERFLRTQLFETLLVERDAASLLDVLAAQTVPNTRSPASPNPGRM